MTMQFSRREIRLQGDVSLLTAQSVPVGLNACVTAVHKLVNATLEYQMNWKF
jgi:hypothetical protein